ncbi:MAG: metallophosphoesterase [Ruminococcaceae bacterium]|nr:metallophosphoesterase [Oscillospiraceae bacterium]
MKILVFSDSHGAYHKMKKAADLHPDSDMIIFLGDGLYDADTLFEEKKTIACVGVKGNCDLVSAYGANTYLDEQTVDIGQTRIFCTHGHKYHAKSTLMNLLYRAQEKEAQLCLYGHTHIALESVFDEVRLFNPGSVRNGEYGIIYIENAAVCTSHAKL